jgi:hypothetical protein
MVMAACASPEGLPAVVLMLPLMQLLTTTTAFVHSCILVEVLLRSEHNLLAVSATDKQVLQYLAKVTSPLDVTQYDIYREIRTSL